MDCCTIASLRQLASVRVLADSFGRHHPGARTFAVILDDVWEEVGEDEPFTVLRVDDLDVGRAHFHRMALLHDERGLARALQPLVLSTVLRNVSGGVVYLAPETLVLGPLDPVARAIGRAPLALTPFLDLRVPADDRTPSIHELLEQGAIDLGLVGVSQDAVPALRWWWDQVALDRRLVRGDPPDPDPQLASRLAVLFEHELVREPGLVVGYWNLFDREVARDGETYTVDGHPLRTFRFPGFDHRQPWLLSTEQGSRPRVAASEHEALADLCDAYATALVRRGVELYAGTPYRFSTLPGGTPVDDRMREAVVAALTESSTHAAPPDPFDPSRPSAFLRWLRDSDRGGAPRYLRGLAVDDDPWRLAEWALASGRAEHGIPGSLVPLPTPGSGRAPEPPEAASDPLALARAWLEDGALTPWDAGTRFGPLGRLWRRLLRRLLRPYEFRQREFQRVITEAVELNARRVEVLHAYTLLLRESLEELADREAAVRAEVSPRLAASRAALQRRLGALEAALGELLRQERVPVDEERPGL